VYAQVLAAGYRVVNIDATVALERPRLRPYIDAMRQNIARILELPVAAVSIKATTTEGLGIVGEGRGAAAYAVCLLASQVLDT
jgi:2-C-methyl-D-erythritol 2,4-cyclodiphosphate synthase